MEKFSSASAEEGGVVLTGEGALRAELRRLRKENARLLTEREIKRRPDQAPPRAGILCQGAAVKFAFVRDHRRRWPVQVICRVLRVTRGGFDAWLKRKPSARQVRQEKLHDTGSRPA